MLCPLGHMVKLVEMAFGPGKFASRPSYFNSYNLSQPCHLNLRKKSFVYHAFNILGDIVKMGLQKYSAGKRNHLAYC